MSTKRNTLWNVTPDILVQVHRLFTEKRYLYFQGRSVNQVSFACFLLVSCLAYYSTLKMEAVCSSETSVNI
jgi:hypothetical protein